MIERYTIKFRPAVSQKELGKALQENMDSTKFQRLHDLRRFQSVITEDFKITAELDGGNRDIT
jgi:hypothetical protein